MIIQVQFFNHEVQHFSGKCYTYLCELPVKVGDHVRVPAGEETTVARVVKTNMSIQDCDISPRMMKEVISVETNIPPSEREQAAAPEEEQLSILDEAPAQEPPADLIVITQLPQIVENLRMLRDRWERVAAEAESLVCTEESVQSMKDARAQMRKEFDEADTQRKQAKAMYMAPWEQVEMVWKECVAEPFKKADSAFKDEIGTFEGRLKDECLENIKRYYTELCIASSVECLSLEKAMELGNIKINLSDAKARTPKKLQDALAAIVNRVGADIDQIRFLDENIRDEVYVEFKKTYNLGASIAAVQDRRRKVEEAKKAAEERAAAQARAQEAADKVMAAAPVEMPPVEQPASDAEEPAEEEIFVEFRVYGDIEKLRALKKFLNDGGYRYVNI